MNFLIFLIFLPSISYQTRPTYYHTTTGAGPVIDGVVNLLFQPLFQTLEEIDEISLDATLELEKQHDLFNPSNKSLVAEVITQVSLVYNHTDSSASAEENLLLSVNRQWSKTETLVVPPNSTTSVFQLVFTAPYCIFRSGITTTNPNMELPPSPIKLRFNVD